MEDIMLYVHIPFCVKKCLYCDFLSAPADGESQSLYVDSLIREMEQKSLVAKGRNISSVFIGGGTPTILSDANMKKLLEAINNIYKLSENTEFTCEANPGTVTKEKLMLMRKNGINRLSFGVQSMDDEELKLLGRIHSAADAFESYKMARECGFENINLDIMSSLPGQSEVSYAKSLEKAISMNPEHISAYSLIIEEGTQFYEKYHEDVLKCSKGEKTIFLPDEDVEYAITKLTEKMLGEAGYHRYEVSNFAKEGRECRHNCGYWLRRDYLGLGLGAASLIGHTRYKNISDLSEYISIYNTAANTDKKDTLLRENSIATTENAVHENGVETSNISTYENREELTVMNEMEETMFLGLRLVSGVSEKRFYEKFGVEVTEVYGERIRKLTEQGLIKKENGFFSLTDRGFDLGNNVFSCFLFD